MRVMTAPEKKPSPAGGRPSLHGERMEPATIRLTAAQRETLRQPGVAEQVRQLLDRLAASG